MCSGYICKRKRNASLTCATDECMSSKYPETKNKPSTKQKMCDGVSFGDIYENHHLLLKI